MFITKKGEHLRRKPVKIPKRKPSVVKEKENNSSEIVNRVIKTAKKKAQPVSEPVAANKDNEKTE